jgi:hypothetical protein
MAKISESIQTFRGLRHGSILFPVLYNMKMDEETRRVKKEKEWIMVYADTVIWETNESNIRKKYQGAVTVCKLNILD